MSERVTLPCISLIDPYARLVVGGIKQIETRTGPVLSGFSGSLLTVYHFGLTRSGAPKHPLYLRNDAPIYRWGE